MSKSFNFLSAPKIHFLYPKAVLSCFCAVALLSCASCGRQQPTERAEANKALTGSSRLFGVPGELVGHANQFGFRATPYAPDGGSFLSIGGPITLSQSDAAAPNTGRFEAAGTTVGQLDRVAFTLAITDPANADTAKQRFADVVRGVLFHYGIEDAAGVAAIVAEQAGDRSVAGIPASLAVTPGEGDTRTIIVTFTRPAASTPGNQQAQGQANGNRA